MFYVQKKGENLRVEIENLCEMKMKNYSKKKITKIRVGIK